MCPLFLAFDQLGAHVTCLIKSYLMHIPNAELNISQQLFLFYFTGIHLCLQSYAAVDALYSVDIYLGWSINPVPKGEPITDVTSNDIICNGGINPYHQPVSKAVITAPAGSTLTAEACRTLSSLSSTVKWPSASYLVAPYVESGCRRFSRPYWLIA